MRRVFNVLVLIPLAIVLIALMVANRNPVPLSIDIFNPGSPALTASAPLFVWLVLATAIGVVIGGCGAWLAQGKNRKKGRQATREAQKLRYEAEQSKRAKDGVKSGNSLLLQR